jgi:hypothetical protein
MVGPKHLDLHHARRVAETRRHCCRTYDELLAIYEELEDAVDDAFDRRSVAPIAHLFARAEAAEARYRQAKRAAMAVENSAT